MLVDLYVLYPMRYKIDSIKFNYTRSGLFYDAKIEIIFVISKIL